MDDRMDTEDQKEIRELLRILLAPDPPADVAGDVERIAVRRWAGGSSRQVRPGDGAGNRPAPLVDSLLHTE